jgi:hypothetical protein
VYNSTVCTPSTAEAYTGKVRETRPSASATAWYRVSSSIARRTSSPGSNPAPVTSCSEPAFRSARVTAAEGAAPSAP